MSSGDEAHGVEQAFTKDREAAGKPVADSVERQDESGVVARRIGGRGRVRHVMGYEAKLLGGQALIVQRLGQNSPAQSTRDSPRAPRRHDVLERALPRIERRGSDLASPEKVVALLHARKQSGERFRGVRRRGGHFIHVAGREIRRAQTRFDRS